MPARKTFLTENSYYHVYNKGVDSRTIFTDSQDYLAFGETLVYYLKHLKEKPQLVLGRTGLKNTGMFVGRVSLTGYVLLPNQFHLLLWQQDKNGIKDFMSRLNTTYAIYFNNRHNRTGPLFQGRFKSKHIDTFDYLLQTSKYIHSLPATLPDVKDSLQYPYSSFKRFVDLQNGNYQPDKTLDEITHPESLLEHFYHSFPNQHYSEFVFNHPYANWFQSLLGWIK